jgi:hypothetical protein
MATGFGFSTRTLNTTDEETTFEFTRPQIITAIDALVTRDDLADRVLGAQLLEITEDKRLPQAELNAKVAAARPRTLGALLTALSQTLARIPETRAKTKNLPRMADYALFAIASEQAIGLKDGDFMKVFNRSREESRRVVIESSPVGEAIVRLMENTDLVWKGTASELLQELANYTDPATYRSRYFPKAHNSLSRQLNRLAPDLEEQGIKVAYFTEGRKCTRVISLEKVVKISSAPSADDLNADRGKSSHRDDLADDTRNTDDKQTIEPDGIVCARTKQERDFTNFADDTTDANDRNTPFSHIDLENLEVEYEC